MSNSVVDFDGLYLVSLYDTITKIVNDLFESLVINDKASIDFLENNETTIVCDSYNVLKTIHKTNYTYDEIRSLVTHNASVVLAHSLIHDDIDIEHPTADQLYKTISYFSGIIHKYYY